MAHFERRTELSASLRGAYSRALGCDSADVALTTCTTEGIAQVIVGLSLSADDEIVTSDEEHPGLLGALGAAREIAGVQIRMVPLAQVAEAVSPATALVACSHVGWISGSLAPTELGQVDVPVLLDGAQGLGAVPLDMAALGCDAYAGAGQKWMCGPDGTGALYVSPELRERLQVPRRGYAQFGGRRTRASRPNCTRTPGASMRPRSAPRASPARWPRRRCLRAPAGRRCMSVPARWRRSSSRCSDEQGREVAPRGPTTLVSFSSPDPEAERTNLAEQGVIVRNIPGRPWLRASVGAWNDGTTWSGWSGCSSSDRRHAPPMSSTSPPAAAPGLAELGHEPLERDGDRRGSRRHTWRSRGCSRYRRC